MTLAFGMSEHFERVAGVADRELYAQKIELVQRAEAHGFYGYHVSEHHNGGLCMAPSPLVFLSAVAQRTSTIRLGTLILILPLYDPLRLLEEICMLDQLSGGRLMPGVGRGVRSIEHRWFGVDPAQARGHFEELLTILRQGLEGGRIDFQGEHYRIDDLTLAFRPLQKPVPIWWAGSLATAAARRASVIGGAGHGVTREAVEEYWAAHASSRRLGEPWAEEPRVGSTRHVVVAETDAEARAIARRAWTVHADNVWQIPFDVNGVQARRGTPGMNVGEDTDLVMSRRRALVAGSPETVTELLAEFLDEVGPGHNYLVSSFQWGDITHLEAMRSLDLFGAEVMPRLALGQVPAAAVG